MIEINLLPKEYRKKGFSLSMGKTGVYVAVGAAAVILTLLTVTGLQLRQLGELDDNIDRAQRRAEMLRKDIQIVDALTDVKGKITQRVAAVEKLDRNRSVWIRLLEEVAGDIPDFVWLSRFTEGESPQPVAVVEEGADGKDSKDDKAAKDKKAKKSRKSKKPTRSANYAQPTIKNIELEGYAFTLNSIAAFMINLMRSDYFEQVELVYSNETKFDEHRAYNFVLSGQMHFLSDEEARKMIAGAATDAATASHKSLN